MGSSGFTRSARLTGRDVFHDLAVQFPFFHEGHHPSRRMEEKRKKGDGPPLFPDHGTGFFPERGEPGGNFLTIPNRCGQEKQVHTYGQVDHDLFPDHPPVPIPQIMGLIQNDQVTAQVFPLLHHIVKLIAKDFRRPDDNGGIRIFLCIPREDSHMLRAELLAEFHPFGIAQRLQRRGIPASSPRSEDGQNGLLRDPGFSGTGGRHDQAVGFLDCIQGLKLKFVRDKLPVRRFADPGKYALQDRFNGRLQVG